MPKPRNFSDVQIISGYYEGNPITDIITAQEQEEAAKYGIYLKDLIKMCQYEDLYRDC
jgi:hypothetical protein